MHNNNNNNNNNNKNNNNNNTNNNTNTNNNNNNNNNDNNDNNNNNNKRDKINSEARARKIVRRRVLDYFQRNSVSTKLIPQDSSCSTNCGHVDMRTPEPLLPTPPHSSSTHSAPRTLPQPPTPNHYFFLKKIVALKCTQTLNERCQLLHRS